jgi:hypothetical protein
MTIRLPFRLAPNLSTIPPAHTAPAKAGNPKPNCNPVKQASISRCISKLGTAQSSEHRC